MPNFNKVVSLIILSCLSFGSVAEDRLKPLVLASTSADDFDIIAANTEGAIAAAGYEIIGSYTPYPGALALVFTSDTLRQTAGKTPLGAFGSVLRASVTAVDDQVQVGFVNPVYLANAYRLKDDFADEREKLITALGFDTDFGSKRGKKTKSLKRYNYMMGMEHFDDVYELARHDSQIAAVAVVDAALAANAVGVKQIYRLELPDIGAVLYGVSMKGVSDDDKYYDDAYQMSVVDFKALRSTAYLPYEILVQNGEVQALHMRFRMAVHFPDLSMMGKHSFMTLMPSPKAIKKALSAAVSPSS